jgi:hypothetical protein
VASQYEADYHGRAATPATIELNLHQDGQRDPVLLVALRRYQWKQGEGSRMEYEHERLKLSIDDARELAAMLEYVIGLAELQPVEETPVARLA